VADECNTGASGRSRIFFLGCVICQLTFVVIYSSSLKMISRTFLQVTATSGGFRVGGARGMTKRRGPLMTSSYSAIRDNNF